MAADFISSTSPCPTPGLSRVRFQRQPWLWPNLLSLDAPIVAVLWQILLIRSLSVHIRHAEPFILALAVWFVYIADRVLDVLRPLNATWEPARKAFYRAHRRTASVVGIALACAVVPLAYFLLKRSTFYAGLALAALLLAYLAFVHLAPVRWRARWPRELAVACFFTLGTFMPIWIASGNIHSIWAPALLFLLLCWANCCAIETWEWQYSAASGAGKPSASARCAARHLAFLSLLIALLAAALQFTAFSPLPFSAAAVWSALVLAALSLAHSRLRINALRVAADLALCTPLLILLVA